MLGPDSAASQDGDTKYDQTAARTKLVQLLLVGLALRLILAWYCPGFGPDMQEFKAWTLRIVRVGPRGLLGGDWAHPPAGSMSPLHVFFLGGLGWMWQWLDPHFALWQSNAFNLLIRLPAIVADVAAVVGFYRLALLFLPPVNAVGSAALLFLSPALLLISAVWGQADSAVIALLLWGTYFLLEKKELLGIVLTACAALIRVPALVFLPIPLLVTARRGKVQDLSGGVLVALALALLTGWALNPQAPLAPFLQQLHYQPDTSVNAFNLWFLKGHSLPDVEGALGLEVISCRVLGAALLLTFLVLSGMKAWESDDDSTIVREMGMVGLAYFLFATRVHERYLLYPLAFLLLAAGGRSVFKLLSFTLFLNVLWVLGLSSFTDRPPPTTGFLLYRWLMRFPAAWGTAADQGWGNFLAVINLCVFMRFGFWPPAESALETEKPHGDVGITAERAAPSPVASIVRLDRLDLALVLIFTLSFGFLRFQHLAAPPDLIFDEVYHAKAGDEILHGKAPNEWVHPPLAKIFISLGIKAFGMNSFGWRFAPWVAGSLVLPLLYLLARNLLADRRAAVIATFLFAVDGCYFVLSRTAMTNIFAVLFQLGSVTSLLLYLKQATAPNGRLGHGWCMLATCAMVSLGVSTRWTCIWLLGAVASIYGLHSTWVIFVRDREVTKPSQKAVRYFLATCSGIIHFIMIPAAVYLASYYPLVRGGGYPDYKYVVSLQPQIWHFHTTFTTHHPYYSQWFSWVFTHRPVWYHYRDNAGMITGIVALGNPLLWWVSVPGIIIASWLAFKRREVLIIYACAAWAVLYLPWGLAPRVLNYSHYYLEPLPYACIAMAWLATVYLEQEDSSWIEVLIVVGVIALCFAFFFPLYSATPFPRRYYEMRLWTRNWI